MTSIVREYSESARTTPASSTQKSEVGLSQLWRVGPAVILCVATLALPTSAVGQQSGPGCQQRCWYRLHLGAIVTGNSSEQLPTALPPDGMVSPRWYKTEESASYALNSRAFIISQAGGPADVALAGSWRTYSARSNNPYPPNEQSYWDQEKHTYIQCEFPVETSYLRGHPVLSAALTSTPRAGGLYQLGFMASLQPALVDPRGAHKTITNGWLNDGLPLITCGPAQIGQPPHMGGGPEIGVYGAGIPVVGASLEPAIRFPFGASAASFHLTWKKEMNSPQATMKLTNVIFLEFRRCPDQNLAHHCAIAGMPNLAS